jgi:hypothetical protein
VRQAADPERAMNLIEGGAPLRVGRSVGRTLYVQTSADPSKDDLYIGSVDSPEIAEWLVGRANVRPFNVNTGGWHECQGRDDCKKCHPNQGPVKVDDLAGIAPDWTGGKTPEEYVSEQRNRGT